VCPECSATLLESDEGGAGVLTHRCPNPRCKGQTKGTLAFIGGREVLEIDGLGPEMASRLVDTGSARSLWELYEFQTECNETISVNGEEKFLEVMRQRGFDVTILKMLKSLEKAKTASWERWIKALCIPMIGATLGKTVAASMNLRPESMKELHMALSLFADEKIEGFGEAKMGAIKEWVRAPEIPEMCKALYAAGVRPTPVDVPKVVAGAPLKGTSFCITGEFSESREAIIAKLVSLGAESRSGVTKKVNLLVAGSDAGKTKLAKAKELGIQQVGKEWLAKTLADNGLTLKEDFEAEP